MQKENGRINMNTRFEQVEFLFSYMFRKSLSSSRKIILSTSCGKRILANAPDILFDQPTANFKELVIELENNNVKHINFSKNTNKRLINAYKKLCEREAALFYSVPVTFPAADEKTKKNQQALLAKGKNTINHTLVENRKQSIALAKFNRRSGI